MGKIGRLSDSARDIDPESPSAERLSSRDHMQPEDSRDIVSPFSSHLLPGGLSFA